MAQGKSTSCKDSQQGGEVLTKTQSNPMHIPYYYSQTLVLTCVFAATLIQSSSAEEMPSATLSSPAANLPICASRAISTANERAARTYSSRSTPRCLSRAQPDNTRTRPIRAERKQKHTTSTKKQLKRRCLLRLFFFRLTCECSQHRSKIRRARWAVHCMKMSSMAKHQSRNTMQQVQNTHKDQNITQSTHATTHANKKTI